LTLFLQLLHRQPFSFSFNVVGARDPYRPFHQDAMAGQTREKEVKKNVAPRMTEHGGSQRKFFHVEVSLIRIIFNALPVPDARDVFAFFPSTFLWKRGMTIKTV
jgi:hypothetical protein